MIGPHFQTTIDHWPNGMAQFQDHTWCKSVVDQHLCRDLKIVNPSFNTVFRWPVPNDHYDPFLNRPNLEGARDFFSRFVDGTFLELAREGAFTAIETVNEVYGNGQNEDERTVFINFEYDCADVWLELQAQHPELRNIKLCLANTAIGNDIPDEIGQLAHKNKHYVCYHSYIPTQNKQVLPHEYPFYSGRFEQMDARWRANGWYVTWLSTEGGPVGYHVAPNGDIHLQGGQGWRYPTVCNRDMGATTAIMGYWLDRVAAWNAQHDNRHQGTMLFTSSRLNDQWGHFQFNWSELGEMGEFAEGYVVQPPEPPPPPPPPPTPTIRRYERTVHLLPQNATMAQAQAVMALAFDRKQSVVWSADDAVMNPDPSQAEITKRNVIVWGDVPGGSLTGWEQWQLDNYPPAITDMQYASFASFEDFRFSHWPTQNRTGGLLGGGINQWFNANPDNYPTLPGHDGVDFHVVEGGIVYAVAPGKVYRVHTDPSTHAYGIHVRIEHQDGYKTIYGHLSIANVIEGQEISAGAIIGFGGSTGNSTGPHLHLTLKKDGSTEAGSGWPYDIIDPEPFMTGL